MRSIVLLFVIFSAVSVCSGDIIYVDCNAPGSNNGSSWTDAFTLLQSALTVANSDDEIRVAAGTYKSTNEVGGSGDRYKTFQMKNGVAIKGGYAGYSEPDPDKRDYEAYETILSGDIGVQEDSNDNCYHVFYRPFGTGTDDPSVLDGFIITAGNANGDDWPHDCGGGIYNSNGSPIVTNCTFIGNSAGNNGGGMYNEWYSRPTVSGCTFIGNTATGGGGMANWDSNSIVTNCTFSDNSTILGGGIDNYTSNPTIADCIFSDNRVEDRGGGIYNGSSFAIITNCTFSGNTSDYRGGGMYNNDSSPTVTNSILWGNTADYGPQIYNEDSSPLITYSDIEGSWPGEGNIDVDPLFADSDANEFHLQSKAGRWDVNNQSWVIDSNTSPCIDAGDWITAVGYEPFPNGGRVNMGAYGGTVEASKSYFGAELCETIIAGDINGDCKVDFIDFAIMSMHWLEDARP